ncbi:hypothetical protein CS542_04690 [Pedobacter sp. IW39]|nr:hypothetical protein CS542_04690 [Pedobacter sp. IW39]
MFNGKINIVFSRAVKLRSVKVVLTIRPTSRTAAYYSMQVVNSSILCIAVKVLLVLRIISTHLQL